MIRPQNPEVIHGIPPRLLPPKPRHTASSSDMPPAEPPVQGVFTVIKPTTRFTNQIMVHPKRIIKNSSSWVDDLVGLSLPQAREIFNHHKDIPMCIARIDSVMVNTPTRKRPEVWIEITTEAGFVNSGLTASDKLRDKQTVINWLAQNEDKCMIALARIVS